MVQLSLENLIPPSNGGQFQPWIKFTLLSGAITSRTMVLLVGSPHGVSSFLPRRGAQAKEVLGTYLPERTRRYSRNIPDPESGESWLRLVLVTGELVRLQPTPDATPIIVAVHASASEWRECFEKISTPEFSAARKALGIGKHWMLILEDIADTAPSSDELMDTLRNQAINKSECGIVRLGA